VNSGLSGSDGGLRVDHGMSMRQGGEIIGKLEKKSDGVNK
jgi:hypothetical protein